MGKTAAGKTEKKTEPKPERSSVWLLGARALFWLLVWSMVFGLVKGCSAVISRGWPRITITWPDREEGAKTPIEKWISKNRPNLEADFPAVGSELRSTAERLESGRLIGPIDAAADTIARVQPVVSNPAEWRSFLNALTGRFTGGDAAALAGEYREAAGSFGGELKAVEALTEIAAGAEEEDEKSDNQTTLETCPIDYPMDLEGPDQSEDKQVDEGPGEEPPKEDNRDPGGGCPSGQCPSGTGTGWGWGWPTFPSYRLF